LKNFGKWSNVINRIGRKEEWVGRRKCWGSYAIVYIRKGGNAIVYACLQVGAHFRVVVGRLGGQIGEGNTNGLCDGEESMGRSIWLWNFGIGLA
jgi:hypothetical protein